MDRAVDRVLDETAKQRLETLRELYLIFTAGLHRGMALSGLHVGSELGLEAGIDQRIRKHEICLCALEEGFIGGLVACISAEQAVLAHNPYVTRSADSWTGRRLQRCIFLPDCS